MQDLIAAYLAAKQKEDAAKAIRLDAEYNLIRAIGNDKTEGAKSIQTPTHKITVTNKVTRSLDYPAYQSIENTLPEGLRFVDYKPEINATKLRHVEAVDPAIIAACITMKPAKPSVSVKEVQ
jgi:hypothetical protein